MTREEEIARFKRDLAEYHFHHDVCFECGKLQKEYEDHPGGYEKLCVYHLNQVVKLTNIQPMED